MQFQACAYCDHPNPVGTNYCNDCGTALHLKPCRICGAVAVAKAQHCPACKAEFPARPTINVDIPWAVPNAPRAGVARATAKSASHESTAALPGPGAEAAELSTTTQAFAATQRLIEKASTRALSPHAATELVLPPTRREPPRHTAGHAPRNPDSLPMLSPMVVDVMQDAPFLEPAEAAQMWRAKRVGPTRRYGPAVFITLLGLVAAVALIYLVKYAGENSSVGSREVASPHKLLRPAATTRRDDDAGPAAAPTRATAAEAADPGASRAKVNPVAGAPPVKAVRPAAESVPERDPETVAERAARVPARTPVDDVATPIATGAVDVDPYSAAIAPVTDSAMTTPKLPASMTPTPPTPPTPPTKATTATTATTAASPTTPTTPTTPTIPTTPAATATTTTGSCRPELQALNLCAKVQP